MRHVRFVLPSILSGRFYRSRVKRKRAHFLMPKQSSSAWKERKARRLGGDPIAQADFLYHKSKPNYVDEYGVRYKLPDNIKVGTKINIVYCLPNSQMQLHRCDGCILSHRSDNVLCGGNGGDKVIKDSLRFSLPADGANLTLLPLVRNRAREGHILYKVRALSYTSHGARAGHVTLIAQGVRRYKR